MSVQLFTKRPGTKSPNAPGSLIRKQAAQAVTSPASKLTAGAILAAAILASPLSAHAQAAPGVTFTPLYSFGHSSTDGTNPVGGLIVSPDGDFYGVTQDGGANGNGTLYKITQEGVENVLHNFDGYDGNDLESGPILGQDGNLYGTTYHGGPTYGDDGSADYSKGTVYKMNLEAQFATIYAFLGDDDAGVYPAAQLLQGADGNFYGTTTHDAYDFAGTAFEITPAGKVSVLYPFAGDGSNTDGSQPFAGLTLGSDGDFYGTTLGGTVYGQGTVFKITSDGVETILHKFTNGIQGNTDGSAPYAGVTLGPDGNFYGATTGGGAHGEGILFRITPAGKLTTLHTFSALDANGHNADGTGPASKLIFATDGNFYGVTGGGANGVGTIFQLTVAGKFTTLYTFSADSATGNTDGAYPNGPLLEYGNRLYGTAYDGGATDQGTVYSLSVPALNQLANIQQFSFTPLSVTGGVARITGTLMLSGPAPIGGATIALTSSRPEYAAVPALVTISAGKTSATFTVASKAVPETLRVVIQASYGNQTTGATVTLSPQAAHPTIDSIATPSFAVTGGTSTTDNRIYLNGNAANDLPVTLTSSNPAAASVTSERTITAGTSSREFTINTLPVKKQTNVTIRATTADGTRVSTQIYVLP